MDMSRVDGVKAPPHDGTPRSDLERHRVFARYFYKTGIHVLLHAALGAAPLDDGLDALAVSSDDSSQCGSRNYDLLGALR